MLNDCCFQYCNYIYSMKRRLAVLIMSGLLAMTAGAQQTSNLHIVTSPNNRMQGFHFNFTLNGTYYKLKSGECLELKLNADSLHIILDDRRWVNKEPLHLHAAASEDLYINIFWGWKKDEKKKIRMIAELICKACYDEMKPKCKRELGD
jgi:hypothetical protein